MMYRTIKMQCCAAQYIKVTRQLLPTTLAIFVLLFSAVVQAAENDTWLDSMQTEVSQSINASANWFDDFFEQENKTKQAKAYAKIRFGLIPLEQDLIRFDSKIRLRAKLPNLKDRWDIIVSDYDENREQSITDEAIKDTSGGRKEEQLNLALRVTHSSKENQYISSRIGFAKGADIYLKSRYKRKFFPFDGLNLEIEPALYYYLDHGFGSRVNLDLEFGKTQNGLFRQTNSWETIQDDNHPTWRHSLLHYYQINPKSALISGIFATGRIINDDYLYDNRGFFMRYRCQAMRKWIYFEIEPFVHFPDFRAHERTYGMALRLEVSFGEY
ncbi:hypothetical protein N7931_07745 [Catenovulum sp. 2E275]|uniref:hypothetical protein n=1 Tax=Catenovulum sp. 2E275 TaxID=2980497 RepID=UPI0021D20B28|nr:hypothetical protein [Catenovulum sp. 2E275]MCU4675527.1 hypothetical protein [Catenovulum sp. 2E275]